MKLELKHLAAYLPYKLRMSVVKDYSIGDGFWVLKGNETELSSMCLHVQLYSCKPILRPLSDLTEEIEVGGERFVPIGYIFEYCAEYNSRHGKSRLFDNEANTQCVIEWIKPKSLSYSSFEILLEWHFDVFGLIEQGLAVDINTLNQ